MSCGCEGPSVVNYNGSRIVPRPLLIGLQLDMCTSITGTSAYLLFLAWLLQETATECFKAGGSVEVLITALHQPTVKLLFAWHYSMASLQACVYCVLSMH